VVIGAALYLQGTTKPFENHVLNIAETVSLMTSLSTFLLGFFSVFDSDDPYVTSGVKVITSVIALVLNVAFVVYIGYLICRTQGGRMKDAPSSAEDDHSQVSQTHTHTHTHTQDEDGVVVHLGRELEEEGAVLTGVAPSESHSATDVPQLLPSSSVSLVYFAQPLSLEPLDKT
jgi:hypothetical protein